jgi:hydroxymethylpyrimidine pyrophosphatase-like HAD family hydrolase
MTNKNIIQSISKASQNSLQNVRLIATDMDGTLTEQGKFTSNLLQILEKLAQTKIDVIIVTGVTAQ